MESNIRFCPCGRAASHGLRCEKHKDKIINKPKRGIKYSGYSKAYIENRGAEEAE